MKLILKYQIGGKSGEYVIQPGDTFGLIAEKLGMSVDELRSLNKDIKDIDKIQAGKVLKTKAKTITNLPTVVKSDNKIVQPTTYAITQENWMDLSKQMLKSYELFLEKTTPVENTSGGYTNLLGYGGAYYIDEKGRSRKVRLGETITRALAEEQLNRWYKFEFPKYLKDGYLNASNWNFFDPRVKLAISDAVYNGGIDMLVKRSPNFMAELKKYNNSFVKGKSAYNIENLLRHADWNKSHKDSKGNFSWLALRSRARQYPLLFDWNKLGEVYKLPVEELQRMVKEIDKKASYKIGGKLISRIK